MKNIFNFFPVRTFSISIFIWILLAIGNYWANHNGYYLGTELLFPFSVIYPSNFLLSGTIFGVIFLILGTFSYHYINYLPRWLFFLLCLLLVIIGNMMQGNIDIAFLQPFYLKGRQYYADAILIQDWITWLKDFSYNQDSFQLHTKTHPPFITLLHYLFLELFNNDILGLSLSFSAISLLSIFIFYDILTCLNFNTNIKRKLTLFFSIIPSFNIYSIVSIDGLFLTFSLIFLLGVCRIYQLKKLDFISIILSTFGVICCNLISFSGLFFFAFLGLFSLYTMYKKNYHFLILSIFIGTTYIGYFYSLYYLLDYNHLEVFFNASKFENKDDFMLLAKPLIYFGTRLEDICEILFFLSFGFVALLFSKNKFYAPLFDSSPINTLFFSATIALITMFLTGAYGTGETARACLFVMPYFLLLLKNIHSKTFSILYYLCLLQTFGMQLIGNFYW